MTKTSAEGVKAGSPRKASRAKKPSASGAVPSVDFPREGEALSAAGYTFRIGCPGEAREVEVSIDSGPWLPCRFSVGYWWHDFGGGEIGRHSVSARARDNEGVLTVSPTREFSVREA